MGLFEVKSNEFISGIATEKHDLRWKGKVWVEQSTGVVKSRRVSLKYETANTLELERASVLSRYIYILRAVADRDVEEAQDLSFDGISMLPETQEMSRTSNLSSLRL